jgi:hypothetical protein
VYFPAGTYNISGVVGSTDKSVHIYGDGSGQSIINFDNGGFNFVGKQTITAHHTFVIENIGIIGTGTNGLRLEYTTNGGVAQKAYCKDVTVEGIFDVGFKLVNTDLSTYEHCSVIRNGFGDNNTAIGVELSVIDPTDTAQGAPVDAVNVRFNNWQFSGLSTAIKIKDKSEGIYIIDSIAIACRTGIDIDGSSGTDGAEPYYVIRGNNLDCWQAPLVLKSVMQCVITDNSFYKFMSYPTPADWVGVEINGNSYDNIITDNIFNGQIDPTTDGNTFTGIDIKKCAYSSFSNNTFMNLDRAYSIGNSSRCNFNSFIHNTYRIVTQQFNTPGSGTPQQKLMQGNNYQMERDVNNGSYMMVNAGGVTVYSNDSPNGFDLDSSTYIALQTLKTAAAASTDFTSLKAAIATALANI